MAKLRLYILNNFGIESYKMGAETWCLLCIASVLSTIPTLSYLGPIVPMCSKIVIKLFAKDEFHSS